MGKQVEFYMTYEDERAFLESFGSDSITLIYNTFKDPEQMKIRSLQPVGLDRYDSNLSILNHKINCRVEYRIVEPASVYSVDLLESEVIQFNRCAITKTWLKNGRLWYEEKHRAGRKSVDFLRWAETVLRWIRKSYRLGQDGRYVGPDAFGRAEEGELVLGPPTNPISAAEARKILGEG